MNMSINDWIEVARQELADEVAKDMAAHRADLCANRKQAAQAMARHQIRPRWCPQIIWQWSHGLRRRRWERYIKRTCCDGWTEN